MVHYNYIMNFTYILLLIKHFATNKNFINSIIHSRDFYIKRK